MLRTCIHFGVLGLVALAGMATAGAQSPGVLRLQGTTAANQPPVLKTPPSQQAGIVISLLPPTGNSAPGLRASATVPGAEMAADVAPRDVRFGNDVPSLRVSTAGPDTLVVGRPAEYIITLANQSEFSARQIVVRIQYPTWVELQDHQTTSGAVGDSIAATDDSKQLAWNVEQIAGNSEQTLALMLVPRAGRAFELGVDVSVRPTMSATKITVKEPKVALQVKGTADVVSGEDANWTISLANPGTGDAHNVRLDLFSDSEKLGTQSIGTIEAGHQRVVNVTLPTHQSGRQVLRAVAVAEPGLTAEASMNYLVRRGVLNVHLQGPAFEYAGTHATYEVRVSNTGDAVARDVRMEFTLPRGAKYIGRVESADAKPAVLPSDLHWTVDSIEPGMDEGFRIACELSQPGDHQAAVRAGNADGLTAAAEMSTHVQAAADLELQVIDPTGPREVGAPVEIEIRITNRGTDAARQVYVAASYAAETELVDVTGNATIESGQIFFEPIEDLAAGETVSQRVTLRAAEAGGHVFRASVECEEPVLRLACEEFTRFFVRDAETQIAGAAAHPEDHDPPMIQIKRVYEPPAKSDGVRILVDRLWPRGLTKERAAVDLWLKEVAPSTELRKWFAHDPAKWKSFQTRYRKELAEKQDALELLKQKCESPSVTLLYGARDEEHNAAQVLKEILTRGSTQSA